MNWFENQPNPYHVCRIDPHVTMMADNKSWILRIGLNQESGSGQGLEDCKAKAEAALKRAINKIQDVINGKNNVAAPE